MNRLLCFLLLLASSGSLLSQNDSTLLLAPERLEEKDILYRDLSKQEVKIISATRSLEVADQQPFSVWVITGEEILRYGFVTLGDVLRAAPGIRVSQPGNAVEGETFLMRGLPGNQYVKILVNDVPIKPAIALGMPIGAQLPIRQAERIEVMYGPASAIYGEEACAGVVNIILKETERPVFTQADLSFGTYSYNSLDLMFGGKLGRDKNIFRYSIYGSSTVREDSDYFYDISQINTNNYLSFGLDTAAYRLNANFRGSSSPKDSFARTNVLPHESRMFGLNLTWRGLHFTYHRLARFDRSALGLNPLAVSYANPSNRLAELIESFSLGFQRKRKKRTSYTTLGFESYQINGNSSTTFVFDRLSSANYYARADSAVTPAQKAALLRNIYNSYASDERYSSAYGIDVRIESRSDLAINRRLHWSLGGLLHVGGGTALTSYYSVPVDLSLSGLDNPVPPQPFYPLADAIADANLFSQLEWKSKRLNILLGNSMNAAIEYGINFTYRLGALYRIDSIWSVRFNSSSGFRQPSLYGQANTFTIRPGAVQPVEIDFRLTPSERFLGGELGLRYRRGKARHELLAFWQRAENLFRPGYLIKEAGYDNQYAYGYLSAPGIAHTIFGIQAMFKSESNSFLTIGGPRRKAVVSMKAELFIQYAKGEESFGYNIASTNDILNQPKWTTQFRTFFKVNKNVEIMMAANKQSSSLSKFVLYKDLYQLKERDHRLTKFATWDLVGRVYLSNHFVVYANFQNIFNRHFAGLDATGTVDDLMYNPQPGRIVRFGVNYNMK